MPHFDIIHSLLKLSVQQMDFSDRDYFAVEVKWCKIQQSFSEPSPSQISAQSILASHVYFKYFYGMH